MSEIQKIFVKTEQEEYELYIEANDTADTLDDEPGYRTALPAVDMQKVHSMIQGYAKYAIGAFVNFGLAEVEEINLEFNLKIAGKMGLPILTEASTEGNFKVQVKCKFPKPPQPES